MLSEERDDAGLENAPHCCIRVIDAWALCSGIHLFPLRPHLPLAFPTNDSRDAKTGLLLGDMGTSEFAKFPLDLQNPFRLHSSLESFHFFHLYWGQLCINLTILNLAGLSRYFLSQVFTPVKFLQRLISSWSRLLKGPRLTQGTSPGKWSR